MKIKPTNGTYLETGNQGFLIRDPALGNFQLNPTDDPEYIREVLDPMKGFLVEEIKKHIQIKVS